MKSGSGGMVSTKSSSLDEAGGSGPDRAMARFGTPNIGSRDNGNSRYGGAQPKTRAPRLVRSRRGGDRSRLVNAPPIVCTDGPGRNHYDTPNAAAGPSRSRLPSWCRWKARWSAPGEAANPRPRSTGPRFDPNDHRCPAACPPPAHHEDTDVVSFNGVPLITMRRPSTIGAPVAAQ